jgi:hypothetical protein
MPVEKALMFQSPIPLMVTAAIVLCLVPATWAQSPPNADDDAARTKRLKFMKDFLDEFSVFRDVRPADPLGMSKEPVLRWTNPVRNFFSDGSLFLWLNDQRPAAAATVSIRGDGVLWLELASLSPDALRCVRAGSNFWTPRKASLVEQPLPDAPAPAATDRMRLVQMRRLCEQFTVRTEPVNEQPTELRLLTQPIYRYQVEADEIMGGAMFAFTETTDPEALLLLEAVRPRSGEAAYWRYTLATMTSRPIVARLDGTMVWSVPGYWTNRRSLNDPYQERQLGTYRLSVQEK